jgi:hypothetical protein
MAGKPPCGRGRTDVHAGYTDAGNGGQITEPTYTYPGQLVAPRQTNTMAADPYVPPTQTAMRPGSLDYQRYASFGDRC